jgi:hypothetical protein
MFIKETNKLYKFFLFILFAFVMCFCEKENNIEIYNYYCLEYRVDNQVVFKTRCCGQPYPVIINKKDYTITFTIIDSATCNKITLKEGFELSSIENKFINENYVFQLYDSTFCVIRDYSRYVYSN